MHTSQMIVGLIITRYARNISVALCSSIVVAKLLQSNLRAARIRDSSVLYFVVHFQTVCVFESASFASSISKQW